MCLLLLFDPFSLLGSTMKTITGKRLQFFPIEAQRCKARGDSSFLLCCLHTTGPAGFGKTSLGTCVSEQLCAEGSMEAGLIKVDLFGAFDQDAVHAALCSAVGITGKVGQKNEKLSLSPKLTTVLCVAFTHHCLALCSAVGITGTVLNDTQCSTRTFLRGKGTWVEQEHTGTQKTHMLLYFCARAVGQQGGSPIRDPHPHKPATE